ncbi:hypothetical protein DXG01_011922 [Tephrocybe rancida]|nr:hypothetical protein DXG01_011922 [Tephrocybe rancida]
MIVSLPENVSEQEQIRQEVERALNAQKRSRARKAAAYTHRSQTESSMENSPYDRESIIDRARARQNSVYTKNTIPHRSLSRSDHDGLLPSGSSRSHAAGQTSPHDFASLPVRPPSSPKKPAFSSRFNPFKKVDNPSSNSACDDESVSDERSDTEPSGPWRKKLEHVAVIAILGYDPDAKQRPWFQKEMI